MPEKTPGSEIESPRSPSGILLNGAVLFGFWVLMSGKIDLLHLGSGVLCVALVLWMDWRLGIIPGSFRKNGAHPRLFAHLLYAPWLFGQMLLAGTQVARVVLSRKMNLEPALIRFKSDQPSSLTQVILGNSITLTPGTLTIDINKDEFLVHGLTKQARDDLLEGTMQRKVAELYQERCTAPVYDVRIQTSEGEGA